MNIPVRSDVSSANLSIISIFPLLGWHHLYRDRLLVFSCSEKVVHRSLEAAILSWHPGTWISEGVPHFPNRWRQLTMFRLFVQRKWFILNNCFPRGSRGFWYTLGEGAPVKMGANSQVSRGSTGKSRWGFYAWTGSDGTFSWSEEVLAGLGAIDQCLKWWLDLLISRIYLDLSVIHLIGKKSVVIRNMLSDWFPQYSIFH